LTYSTKTGLVKYSNVVAVPHAKNDISAKFNRIVTDSGKDVKMTSNHLIAAKVCGTTTPVVLRAASTIQVEDCVQTISGEERVVSNTQEMGRGVYTVVTMEDAYLVVNGIVASPFATNHAVGTAFYSLHRALYTIAPKLMETRWFANVQAFAGDLSILFGK
jgi:Hint module